VINPLVGDYLYGYSNHIQITGIHDNLTVTALYIKSQEKNALLLTFDLVGMRQSNIDIIRRTISRQTKVPLSRIFLTMTHTHSGPFTTAWDYLPRKRQVAVSKYLHRVGLEATEAAQEAIENAEECILKYNYTQVPINMNRRFTMPDRRFYYIPDHKQLAGLSDGYVDAELGIIAFIKKGSANLYKAIITNFSAHALCVGNTTTLASADYPGYLRKAVEETFNGVKVLTTTGAVGDLHPQMPEAGFAYAQSFGSQLAIQVMQRLYDSVEVTYDTKLRTAYKKIVLKSRDRSLLAYLPLHQERAALKGKIPAKPQTLTTAYSLLGIGPLLLVGLPGEPSGALGAMLKWSSPFLKTYVMYQATGEGGGYMLPRNQVYWGGYEILKQRSSPGQGEYLIQSALRAADYLLKKDSLAFPQVSL